MESLEDFFVDSADDPYNWREDESESVDDDNGSEDESNDANAVKMPDGWEPAGASTFPYTVLFNNVDDYLLETARATVPKIVANIKKAVGLKVTASHRSISILQLSKIWFNNELLRELLNRVNDSLPTKRVSAKEMLGFMGVELYLCIYRCSPEEFYDTTPEAKAIHPAAEKCIPHILYKEILQGLSKKQKITDAASRDLADEVWRPPLSLDRELVSLHAQLRETCRKIFFIPDETILCEDDHHERKRSNTCKQSGFAHIYNPDKALGPVMHTLADVVTGAFLGGIVQQVGQTVNECTAILMRSICLGRDADPKEEVHMKNCFDCDRAYSQKEAASAASEIRLRVTSSVIRLPSNPISDGKGKRKPSAGQRVITSQGASYTEWAKRDEAHGSSYFMYSRNGTGTAFHMQTNRKEMVNSFTIIPFPCYADPKPISVTDISDWAVIECTFQFITVKQRTVDWFMMRRFSQTSTVADNTFSAVARNNLRFGSGPVAAQHTIESSMMFTMNLLGFQYLGSPPKPATDTQRAVDRSTTSGDDIAFGLLQQLDSMSDNIRIEFLKAKSVKELKDICRTLGVVGFSKLNKSSLLDLVVEHTGNPRSMIKKPINVGEQMLHSYNLTPFSKGKTQDSMLIGSLNEDNIIGHVKGFIARHDPCLTVIDSRAYGLIGFKHKRIVPESQLTSIDQVYRVEEKLEADEPGGQIQIRRFFIGCEAKTKTTGATEAAAIVYMNVHLEGKAYDKISIKSDADAALLKKFIPDRSHRVQVLHHAATTQLLDMFYVIASIKRIIRLVHITFSASVLANYCDSMKFIQRKYMNWIYPKDDGTTSNIPTFKDYGYATSHSVVVQQLAIWRIIRQMIADRGAPLPPFRLFLPTVAAVKNRFKSAVDGMSAFVARVKAVHHKLSTEGQLLLTMVILMHMNSFVCWRLICGLEFLMDKSLCKSYESYKKHLNVICGSFRKFLYTTVVQLEDLSLCAFMLPTVAEEMEEPEAEDNADAGAYTADGDSPKIHLAKNGNQEHSRMARQMGYKKKGRHAIGTSKNGTTCPICCSRSPGLDIHSRFGFKTKKFCTDCKVHLCTKPRWTTDGVLVDVTWKDNPQLHTVQLSCFEVYHTFDVLPVLHDSCCQKAGISHNPQEPAERPSKIKRGRLAVHHISHVNHLGNDSMDQIEGAEAAAIEVDSISLGPPPPKVQRRSRSALMPGPRIKLRKTSRV